MEFKDEALVRSLLEGKQEVKIEDRVLIVASARESKTSKKSTKVNDENKKTKQKPAGTWNVTSITIISFRFSCSASSLAGQFLTLSSRLLCPAAAKPNNRLYVSNLSSATSGKSLKKLFPTAVNITVPQVKGKSKGYVNICCVICAFCCCCVLLLCKWKVSKATSVTLRRFAFIEFATQADTEKALQSCKGAKLNKKNIGVEMYNMQENAYKTKGMSSSFFSLMSDHIPQGGPHECCKWMLHPPFISLLKLQHLLQDILPDKCM